MQFRGHDFGVELLCLSSQKGYVKNDAVKLSISSTSHLLKILSGKHNLEIKSPSEMLQNLPIFHIPKYG